MYRIPIFLALVLPGAVSAQSATETSVPASPQSQETTMEGTLTTDPPELTSDERGILSYVDFNANTNSTGHMLTTGVSLGYQFNQYVSVDAYVPFYYVSASTTTTDSTGATQSTTTTDQGIGDPSFSLLLAFPNRTLDYKTRVATWVPVADTNSGFTTGSVLVDWTSQFSRSVGPLLPFGQIGIANTVPQSPLFLLPYTAEGFNARFEAGSHAFLTRFFSAGASFYYVLPSGTQTLYSREFHGPAMGTGGTAAGTGFSGNGSGNGPGGGSSDGNGGDGGGSGGGSVGGNGDGGGGSGGSGGGGNGGGNPNRNWFMTQQVVEGNDLTRDHGLSTWFTAALPRFIDLQVGFDHSYGYDLNTVSFGVGVNLSRTFRHKE